MGKLEDRINDQTKTEKKSGKSGLGLDPKLTENIITDILLDDNQKTDENKPDTDMHATVSPENYTPSCDSMPLPQEQFYHIIKAQQKRKSESASNKPEDPNPVTETMED